MRKKLLFLAVTAAVCLASCARIEAPFDEPESPHPPPVVIDTTFVEEVDTIVIIFPRR